MTSLRRGPKHTQGVVVVIPAASVRDEPRVFRSILGQPAQEAHTDSPKWKMVASKEIHDTYDLIESKTARRYGAASVSSWAKRKEVVVQFTVNVPDSRPKVVLARFERRLLSQSSNREVLESILECARAASIPLDPSTVDTALDAVSHNLGHQPQARRPS